MGAVATLMESREPSMMNALAENDKPGQDSPPNDQGSPLFYVLFGLCIESLARVSSSSGSRSDSTMTLSICLNSLKTFIHPSLAGPNFVPKAVFLELMNVFDRLVQTEGTQVQLEIVNITERIVNEYGSKYICDDLDADG
jgi:HEAT repeat-containing protein 5